MPGKQKPIIITEEIDENSKSAKNFKTEKKIEDPQKDKLTPETVDTQKPQVTSFRNLDSDKPEIETPKPSPIVDEKITEDKVEVPAITDVPENVNKYQDDEKMSSSDVKKWLSEVRPDTTKEMDKSSKPIGKIFGIIFLILIILGVSFGGFYYYKTNVSNKEDNDYNEEVINEVATSPTAQPEPTKLEVNLKNVKVQILNGSGIAGEAGKASTSIEEAGFNKPNTGNADNYNYTTTVVKLKENLDNQIYEKVKEALGKSYVIEKSEEKLKENSDYDVVIIIGNKKS